MFLITILVSIIILLLVAFIHFYTITCYLLFSSTHCHKLEFEYLDDITHIINLNIFEILIIYYFRIYFKDTPISRVYCVQNGKTYYFFGYINKENGSVVYNALTTEHLIIRK